MKNIQNRLFILVLLTAAIAGQAFGQAIEASETDLANLQAINNLDAANAPLNRLIDEEGKPFVKAPFVKHVTVNLNGSGVNVVAMQIPAGKRLVIENVSAIVRSAESQRVEINYYTYTNNGGAAARSVNELVLNKQSSFKDSAIFTTNQNVSVRADELIGSEHFSVGISARLVGVDAQFAQAQFTFTGYLEDLPAN